MKPNLNIYKASAGSGKTYRLTGFYLELLFNDKMNASEILAVTFTNKATAEMKTRIITELYKLARTPEKSGYIKTLSQGGTKTVSQVKKEAEEHLKTILNNYASFNISTIDSFFQKIVRDLARELNLAGGLEVELGTEIAIQEGVARFLASLNDNENKEKLNWMREYSNHVMEDGGRWDFSKSLTKLAKQMLNSEEFKCYRYELEQFTGDKNAIKEYSDRLKSIVRLWKESLQTQAKIALEAMEEMGVTIEDFKGGKGSGLITLLKWAKGDLKEIKITPSFISKSSDSSEWFSPRSQHNGKQSPKLQEALQRCVELVSEEGMCNYRTAECILKNFHQLCIMADLDRHMKAYCEEQGIMLLSSTPELLARLIKDDDAPFIYEKMGALLRSYMIDEFQDTSTLQWTNFKPLLGDAIGQGTQNLIVGDVKQSIYRWRGGDWRLLDNYIGRFRPEQQHIDTETLRNNYRSENAIVDFNNKFFEMLAEDMDGICNDNEVTRIYGDVEQGFNPNGASPIGENLPGLVDIDLFTPEDGEKALDAAMRLLPAKVKQLREAGFRYKDIAVLCRWNKECEAAANVLLDNGIDIISGEALVISARPIIQTIISILRHFSEPESAVTEEIMNHNLTLIADAPTEISIDATTAVETPLYELCQNLFNMFPEKVRVDEQPFIEAFLDLIIEYTASKNGSLKTFLEWWDEKGCTSSITTSDEQDAVLVLTVHKSKGLGMPAVIVPLADWNMNIDNGKSNIIWCKPDVEPFKTDHPVHLPISISADLPKTIFKQEYAEEQLCTIIDNVNTAYVAFTRSKKALVIMTPSRKTNKADTNLGYFLSKFTDGKTITYGTLDGVELYEKDEQSNGIVQNISNQAIERGAKIPELILKHNNSSEARERGNMIHRALQEVSTYDSMPDAVHRLYKQEILDSLSLSEIEMITLLEEKLTRPEIAPWFAPDVKVYNEMTLLDKDGTVHRPDRIIVTGDTATVIDYKTGGDHKGYRPQVARYMRILKNMGFKEVIGFLWFLETDNIVEVFENKK